MAVENKYTNDNNAAGKLSKSVYGGVGSNLVVMVATEEIAAADDDGSVYRLFKSVPSSYIPVEISIMSDGITGGSDYDLGLYEVGAGAAVVDKDILMDGQTMASALTRASGHQLGLQTVAIENVGKTLGELAVIGAATEEIAAYDIALTANTVGTAAGTISVIAIFAQG